MKKNNYGLPEEISLQAIYDKVSVHLIVQGRPSVREETHECLYRSEDQCACAVGCLISDEDYNPLFEQTSAENLIDNKSMRYSKEYVRVSSPFPPEFSQKPYRDLLADLQVLHDNAPTDPDGLFDRGKLSNLLARIAARNDLHADAMWEVSLVDIT